MSALHRAYPRRVGEPRFQNGDWTVELRGVAYYYAGGRLLPSYLTSHAAE